MKRIILFSLCIIALIISCQPEDEDNIIQDTCDQEAIIDTDLFKYDSSLVTIVNVELKQDCLHIKYSASGCDGDSWKVKLIDSEFIEESSPTQRSILLSLENKELCLAVFSKTTSFDLSPLRIEGENEIVFHLKGWEDDITYLY